MKRCAVYVHVPFCVKKCAYCDFASYPGTDTTAREAYVQAVINEIREFCRKEKRIASSVFFGGGTPTLLTADQLIRIMDAIREGFALLPDAEITTEANPGTVDIEKLTVLRRAGFNRISFGAQSAEDKMLETLGRIHRWIDARNAVLMAKQCGFDNISLDLMYALPGQTEDMWRHTLTEAAALPITHISCYSLILEEGTALYTAVQNGLIDLPDEDVSLAMHRMILPILREHGFDRYEISNYARNGRRSEHNCAYWLREDYAGFGCAAHSLVDNERYSNPDLLSEYMRGLRHIEMQKLTERDALEETLMLTTRMTEGIDLPAFERRFGASLTERCGNTLRMLLKNGAVRIENGRFFLTERGFEVHSYIVDELVTEWEKKV